MRRTILAVTFIIGLLATRGSARASVLLGMSTDDQLQNSAAVFWGTMAHVRCYESQPGPAKGYEVYELYGSTKLTSWTRVLNPLVPTNFMPGTNFLNITNSAGNAPVFTNGAHYQFVRILKVP